MQLSTQYQVEIVLVQYIGSQKYNPPVTMNATLATLSPLYAASRDMLVTVRGLPRVSYCGRHTANKMMCAAFARNFLHAA